jgi:hypothetical protein
MKYYLILLLFFSINAFSWEGYDYNSGNHVEIDKGNLVRSGSEIQYYDYGDGEYKYGEVQAVDGFGGSVDVQVLDYDTGEYRTFTMDE